jgi:hypothetical protein
MTIIRNYFRNFRFYNKTNEFGFSLALIALVFVIMWAMMIGAAFAFSGQVPTFGWWATLPVTFSAITVAHFMIRPITAARINGQK